ncbi:hypothetical protein ACB092_08G063200 [Castanea dentata]
MATVLTSPPFLIILYLISDVNFIYNGFHQANLHLDGIAKIHPNVGYAFHPLPLKFNTTSTSSLTPSLSFSTNFVFAIVPQIPNLGGHGLTFTISPSWDFTHAVTSQFLGLFNSKDDGLPANHILAIELDTLLNPELLDINKNHVGIDVNSVISVESAPASYIPNKEGKNISLDLLSGNPMHLWIDYDEAEKLLNVTLAPTSSSRPDQPFLSTPIDLSRVLLDSMYIGFIAATGGTTSDHYILGWGFNKSGQAQSLDVSKLTSLPRLRKRKEKVGQVIMILLLAVLLVIVLITILGAACISRRKIYEELREEWEREYGPHRFIYKNLYKARLLGSGGFGKVYRGILPSNVQIAVKRVSHDSKQGMKEFVAEIISMGRLRHRNLVQLLGYCSLDKFLYDNEKPNLNWIQRFRILRGVVLHRDVKASNLTRTGRATTCTDVFALGAFMLEVACGRRPIERRLRPIERRLPEETASDPRLEGNYVMEEMELVLKLGLLCSHSMPAARPSMRQVMQFLDGNADLPKLPYDNVVLVTLQVSAPSSSTTDSILKSGR